MYDARGKTGPFGSDALFGVLTLCVVAFAFLAVWKGPDLMGGGSAPVSAMAAVPAEAAPASAGSPQEQRYLAALAALSPQIHSDLERRLSADGLDRAAMRLALQEAGARAFMEHAANLPHVAVDDLDRMLERVIGELEKASRSGSELCKGSMLAKLEGMAPAKLQRELGRAGLDMDAADALSLELGADALEMLARARSNPARHGKLTARDETALQGLAMSLMADPQIMQAMMASSEREAMAGMDVCALGVSALSAVRDLPDGTKGRAWAAMFDQPDVKRALRDAGRMLN